MNEVLSIICKVVAISNFAKDIHYSVKSSSMYGNHLFADRTGEQDNRLEFVDLIKEVFYLGRGESVPDSKEIETIVAKILPIKTEDEDKNWALLKQMIKECLVDIEELKDLTRGEENLIGALAQDLQQANGLLGLRVDDVYDYVEGINKK